MSGSENKIAQLEKSRLTPVVNPLPDEVIVLFLVLFFTNATWSIYLPRMKYIYIHPIVGRAISLCLGLWRHSMILQELSFSFCLNLKHSTPRNLFWEPTFIISVKQWYLEWTLIHLSVRITSLPCSPNLPVCAPHKGHQQGAEWKWYLHQALLTTHKLSIREKDSGSSKVSPMPSFGHQSGGLVVAV